VLDAGSADEALRQAKLYEGDISLLIVNHTLGNVMRSIAARSPS
jgi:hypothetical protein